jgi:hypothetical protein
VITALAQVANCICEASVDFAAHRHSHPQRRIPDELDRVCHSFSLSVAIALFQVDNSDIETARMVWGLLMESAKIEG